MSRGFWRSLLGPSGGYEAVDEPGVAGGAGAEGTAMMGQMQQFNHAHEQFSQSFKLLRSLSRGDKQCRLCFDTANSNGVTCSNDHFVCQDDCVASYVHSLCEQPHRLRQLKGAIPCPVPDCNAPHWSVEEVREGLREGHEPQLAEYMQTLDSFIEAGTEFLRDVESTETTTEELLVMQIFADALCLRCPYPNCKAVLDIVNTDCCSIHCTSCSGYFCWLCLRPSGEDSNQSHRHVFSCAENPGGGLFVSTELMAPIHKRRRLENLRRALLVSKGNGWRKAAGVVSAVEKLQDMPLLNTFGITAEDILDESEVSIVSRTLKQLRSQSIRDVLQAMLLGLLAVRGLFYLLFADASDVGEALSNFNTMVGLVYAASYHFCCVFGEITYILGWCGALLNGLPGVLNYCATISFWYWVTLTFVWRPDETVHTFADEFDFVIGAQGILILFVTTAIFIAQVDRYLYLYQIWPVLVGSSAAVGFSVESMFLHKQLLLWLPWLSYTVITIFYALLLTAIALLKADYHYYRGNYSPMAIRVVTFLRPSESFMLVAFLVVACADANNHR